MKNSTAIITMLTIGGALYVIQKRGGVMGLVDQDGKFSSVSDSWGSLGEWGSDGSEFVEHLSSALTSVVSAIPDTENIRLTIGQTIANLSDSVEKIVPSISKEIELYETAAMRETMTNEGLRLNVYLDTVGKETIGYGHMLTSQDKASGIYSSGITKDQARRLFHDDYKKHREELFSALPWVSSKPQAVQDVLIDMAFNMGIGSSSRGTGLLGFVNTLAYIESGNYSRAANGILQSKYARQVGNRAVRNANKIRNV